MPSNQAQYDLVKGIEKFCLLWEKMLNFQTVPGEESEMKKEGLMVNFCQAYYLLKKHFNTYALLPVEEWVIESEDSKGQHKYTGIPSSHTLTWEGLKICLKSNQFISAKTIISISFGKDHTVYLANLDSD